MKSLNNIDTNRMFEVRTSLEESSENFTNNKPERTGESPEILRFSDGVRSDSGCYLLSSFKMRTPKDQNPALQVKVGLPTLFIAQAPAQTNPVQYYIEDTDIVDDYVAVSYCLKTELSLSPEQINWLDTHISMSDLKSYVKYNELNVGIHDEWRGEHIQYLSITPLDYFIDDNLNDVVKSYLEKRARNN